MIRRLVLDVLKPHEPGLIEFTEQLNELECITGVTAKLVEMEENVRTIRLTIEGSDLVVADVEAAIGDLGASIHSVDEVSCGDRIVDDPWISR